jgi:WD40 repeat protein
MPHRPIRAILRHLQLLFFLIAVGALVACDAGSSTGVTARPRTLSTPALVYSRHQSSIYDAWWSPDGARLVSASQDGTVQIWDAATGKTLLTIKGDGSPVYAATWSPDGAEIASGGAASRVYVWHVG